MKIEYGTVGTEYGAAPIECVAIQWVKQAATLL